MRRTRFAWRTLGPPPEVAASIYEGLYGPLGVAAVRDVVGGHCTLYRDAYGSWRILPDPERAQCFAPTEDTRHHDANAIRMVGNLDGATITAASWWSIDSAGRIRRG